MAEPSDTDRLAALARVRTFLDAYAVEEAADPTGDYDLLGVADDEDGSELLASDLRLVLAAGVTGRVVVDVAEWDAEKAREWHERWDAFIASSKAGWARSLLASDLREGLSGDEMDSVSAHGRDSAGEGPAADLL